MNQFVNPALLWWLIPLALAPIIIHLLNRRRYRNVPWAAMHFILAAYKRTNRRVRLENLILLLLRTAIMILLVMALARPFFSGGSAASLIAQETTKNVIVGLDQSYSMTYRDQFSTPFDRAKSFCDRLIGRLKEDRGDTVSVVTFADTAVTSPEKSLLLEEARTSVGELSPGFGGTRLPAALSEIIRLLSVVKTNPEVYIVSDLRRQDWLAASSLSGKEPSDRGAVGALLKQISDTAKGIHIVDIGSDELSNVAVVDLVTRDSTSVVGEETEFLAEIVNRGERLANFEATFVVDGNPTLHPAAESIGPGESTVVEFRHVFRRPGPKSVSVRIVSDKLRADDERFLAINILDSVKVLVVDGDPSGDSPLEKETGFLEVALSPNPIGDEVGSVFSVHETLDTTFASRIDEGLQQYDLLVLANLDLSRVPEDRMAKIKDFVRDGGGLMMFLGDRVDPTLYSKRFYQSSGEDILPCRLVSTKSAPSAATGSRLDPEFEHPIFKVFVSQDRRPLLTEVPIRQYIQVRMAPEAPFARVIARYDGPNGPPAIVENRYGFGRVMLFTTSADGDWTDWPILPSYLPVIQETAKFLTSKDRRRKNPLVGQPIQRDMDAFIPNIKIFPPSEPGSTMQTGTPVSLRALAGREGWFRASYPETQRPGLYRMTADTPFDKFAPPETPGEDIFAVNVPDDEGALDRVSKEELRQAYPEIAFHFSQESQEQATSKQEEGEIWKTLIIVLCLLLLSESILARFFGDYKRS